MKRINSCTPHLSVLGKHYNIHRGSVYCRAAFLDSECVSFNQVHLFVEAIKDVVDVLVRVYFRSLSMLLVKYSFPVLAMLFFLLKDTAQSSKMPNIALKTQL